MTEKDSEKLEKIISLSKRRGFIYPSSEIYGGFSAVYDYGPYGSELIRNIKESWWKNIVQRREEVMGIDGAILMHPKIWEASGHIASFTDPLVECSKCKQRFRADQLEGWHVEKDNKSGQWIIHKVGTTKCENCGGKLGSDVKEFNLLMETSVGAVEGKKQKVYLKGESCQNIYVDYQPVMDSNHPALPFGIAQIGKAFRNEITTKNFIYRTREFEQMDLQYFVRPEDSKKYYEFWKQERMNWYIKELGIDEGKLHWRRHEDDERIFYAADAWDIEYDFPFGRKELEGVHNRTNYDLTQHAKFSGKKLEYFDSKTNKSIVPYIIETSGGIGRAALAVMSEAYTEEDVNDRKRVVMKFSKSIAPIKAAIFPLLKDESITKVAREIFEKLKDCYMVEYDEKGSVGKRYRRQDEIGTPYCITVDHETLENDTVTIRDRDTMEQVRIPKEKIVEELFKRLMA